MRLTSTLLTALLLSASLTACSAPDRNQPVNSPTVAAVAPTPPATPEPDTRPLTTEPLAKTIVGEYEYTGFDDKGVKIITGRLNVTYVKPEKFYEYTVFGGNWELKEVEHRDGIGRQVGSGDILGSILDGEVIMDLNPELYNKTDNHVLLKGKIAGARYEGAWTFGTKDSILSKGTFEAVRLFTELPD